MQGLIFLDTETTGLEQGRLVELAWSIDGEAPRVLRCKPPVPISLDATVVHGITQKEIDTYPIFKSYDWYPIIKESVANFILIAHNALFDIGVLNREGIRANDYIDTKRVAMHLIPESPKHNLQYLRYFLGLEVEDAEAHSAIGDVKVLIALYEELYNRLKMEGYDTPLAITDRMILLSKRTVLLTLCAQKKHLGERWEDIVKSDPGYLAWMFSKIEDWDTDLQFTIRHYIEKKETQ